LFERFVASSFVVLNRLKTNETPDFEPEVIRKRNRSHDMRPLPREKDEYTRNQD